MIKRYRPRTVKILHVQNRTTQQFGEKFAFCNAVAVQVSDPGHRLARDRVQIVAGHVIVFQIEAVLFRAVRAMLSGLLKRNDSNRFLTATEISLTTISFWRPLKNSKSITISISVKNDETTINYLPCTESWSSIYRRCRAGILCRFRTRNPNPSVGLLTRRQIARQMFGG